jgi:hypothetical protein
MRWKTCGKYNVDVHNKYQDKVAKTNLYFFAQFIEEIELFEALLE